MRQIISNSVLKDEYTLSTKYNISLKKAGIKYEYKFYGNITSSIQDEITNGLYKIKKDIEKALLIPVNISTEFVDMEMSLIYS